MSYRFGTLYSGSTGNAAYFANDSVFFLIDAGKNARTLQNELAAVGLGNRKLDAVFVTHEHSDHISALPVFLKRHRVAVYLPEPSAPKLLSALPPECQSLIRILPPMGEVEIGNVRVTSFPTLHDSCASVGYRIDVIGEETCFSVGIATDMGRVSEEVKKGLFGCESVILESNHDIDMLKSGPYPAELKRRILSRYGHLSNEGCAELAAYLAQNGTKRILLAHLSQENNEPGVALGEVRSCLAGTGVTVRAASPCEPVEIL